MVLPPRQKAFVDRFPGTLKEIARWGFWKFVLKENGKWDKVPYLSTAKPQSWHAFEKVLRMRKSEDEGFGFCVTNIYGIIAIDLDRCLGEGQTPEPWAAEIVGRFRSYTEVSPSDLGLRIFARVDGWGYDKDWVNAAQGIEVYVGSGGRYLTVTGDHWEGTPEDLTLVDDTTLAWLAEKYRVSREVGEVEGVEEMPEIKEGIALPNDLNLEARRFLENGEHDGDRSKTLQWTARKLFECGLNREEVFSVMAQNEHVMAVCLEKRGDSQDRALDYLWRHQVLKSEPKAIKPISPDAFEDCSLPVEQRPPTFTRDKKGQIVASIDNVVRAVRSPLMTGMEVRKDLFRDEIVLSEDGGKGWIAFDDSDYTRLRITLEQKGFPPVGREMIRDAVGLVAKQNAFDTAIFWLERLKWDGKPRVEQFFHRYFAAENSPYVRAVSRYAWTALAGRVLVPGIKADMVPVLIGDQGIKKTSCLAEMVPSPDFFTEIDIDERREADNSRKMRGTLIAELAELKGLKSRDAEYVKAFITRTHEEWTPKFHEFAKKFARRLVFFGTTNEDEFLADTTGNRRWLPFRTNTADIEGVRRDREQLWAEARELFKRDGIAFREAEDLGKTIHHHHMISEPWADEIAGWLGAPNLDEETPRQKEYLTRVEIMRGALRLDPSRQDRYADMRIARAMKELGYEKARRYVDGVLTRVFVPRQHANL